MHFLQCYLIIFWNPLVNAYLSVVFLDTCIDVAMFLAKIPLLDQFQFCLPTVNCFLSSLTGEM